MFYSFKPNSKQLVANMAVKLYGTSAKVVVTGQRLSPLTCKQLSMPSDSYLTECTVDGKFIAQANSRDWRKSYKLLVTAVQDAHAEAARLASETSVGI
jgi:hypothetical protein